MKTFGFAVIGCGAISEFHIESIQQIENAKLVGVASRNEQRARQTGERARCSWTTDYRELLRSPEVDIVCVTTNSGSHGEIGLEVLKHGKHLIIEKPIAMTTEEADKLIEAAQSKQLTLSVVSQRRFEEQHQIVKQVLSEGLLGNLLAIEVSCPFYRSQSYYDQAAWRGTLKADGGALMNQGIHSIDLMLWMGGSVKSVFGKVDTRTHVMEAEDIGMALVNFQNGALGTILSTTSFQPGYPPLLNIFGEKGSIKIEGTTITDWTVPGTPMPRLGSGQSSGGGVSDPKSISKEYHRLQLIDMINAVSKDRPPLVSGIDGKNSVLLIEAIYQSSELGKEIQVS